MSEGTFHEVLICRFGHENTTFVDFDGIPGKRFCVTCYTDFVENGLPEVRQLKENDPWKAKPDAGN